MPCADTRYFGRKEFSDDAVIRLPRGLTGYESETTFVLLSLPEQFPLVYMQSVRTADLCFVALPVLTVDNRYELQLADEDARLLELSSRPRVGEEVLCLTLVAVDEKGGSVNLLAPIVVNIRSGAAAQCVNNAGSWSHQHPLLPVNDVVAAC